MTVATSVISDDQGSMDSNAKAAKPTGTQIMKSVMALLVSAAGAAASVWSVMFVPVIIVYVAGGLCMMNFPIVTYKEMKILLLPSRRKAVDELEHTMDILKSEAEILEEEIEFLLGHMSHFGEVEEELKELALSQGYKIEELVDLMRVNEETMDLLRENLRQKVIQDVVGIILRSEKQSRHRMDRVEAKLLALKITVKLESYGITFDEDKFLQAVALNPTLWGVAGTVRKLLAQEEDQVDDESTSVSHGDDVYDMFYMDQQRRGSGLEGGRVSLAKRRQSIAVESRHLPPERAFP